MNEAPNAPIVWHGGLEVVIKCPYCKGRHQHKIGGDSNKGQRTRRAPGCGPIATPDQRIAGYWITIDPITNPQRKA